MKCECEGSINLTIPNFIIFEAINSIMFLSNHKLYKLYKGHDEQILLSQYLLSFL